MWDVCVFCSVVSRDDSQRRLDDDNDDSDDTTARRQTLNGEVCGAHTIRLVYLLLCEDDFPWQKYQSISTQLRFRENLYLVSFARRFAAFARISMSMSRCQCAEMLTHSNAFPGTHMIRWPHFTLATMMTTTTK